MSSLFSGFKRRLGDRGYSRASKKKASRNNLTNLTQSFVFSSNIFFIPFFCIRKCYSKLIFFCSGRREEEKRDEEFFIANVGVELILFLYGTWEGENKGSMKRYREKQGKYFSVKKKINK